MLVERDGDRVYFEYHVGKTYVRRTVSLHALTDFLIGGPPPESNLVPGKEPVTFERFVEEVYLPMSAKHRLKPSSYEREVGLTKALGRMFAAKNLHEIAKADWERYKDARLSGRLETHAKEGTVLKEFKCLRAVLAYGVDMGLLRRNVMADVKKLGLADGNRADIWLTKEEIGKLMEKLSEPFRSLFEFRVLTGARPDETSRFGRQDIYWDRGEIRLFNSKRKKNSRAPVYRFLNIKSLGRRFEVLLKRLSPHPESGVFFYNSETGIPYSRVHVARVFKEALMESKVEKDAVAYDLRGTFAMHRAMVIKTFRQLQTELGHSTPASIQHYLDQAERFDPKESIFYEEDGAGEA